MIFMNKKQWMPLIGMTIAYIDEEGKEHVYRGECEGLIHDKMVGTNGFGYDPIFYYPEFKTTLANVSEEKKNPTVQLNVNVNL